MGEKRPPSGQPGYDEAMDWYDEYFEGMIGSEDITEQSSPVFRAGSKKEIADQHADLYEQNRWGKQVGDADSSNLVRSTAEGGFEKPCLGEGSMAADALSRDPDSFVLQTAQPFAAPCRAAEGVYGSDEPADPGLRDFLGTLFWGAVAGAGGLVAGVTGFGGGILGWFAEALSGGGGNPGVSGTSGRDSTGSRGGSGPENPDSKEIGIIIKRNYDGNENWPTEGFSKDDLYYLNLAILGQSGWVIAFTRMKGTARVSYNGRDYDLAGINDLLDLGDVITVPLGAIYLESRRRSPLPLESKLGTDPKELKEIYYHNDTFNDWVKRGTAQGKVSSVDKLSTPYEVHLEDIPEPFVVGNVMDNSGFPTAPFFNGRRVQYPDIKVGDRLEINYKVSPTDYFRIDVPRDGSSLSFQPTSFQNLPLEIRRL